jgi:hypothetical protein
MNLVNPKPALQPTSEFWATFEKLDSDLVELHADWALFKQLYGKSSPRVDLLNKVAASFFSRLQWIMLRDVIISISRLLDPPRMRGSENLVLEQLVEQLTGSALAPLRDVLVGKLKAVRATSKPLQTYRHKRVAHRDKEVAVGLESLPGISRQLIEDSLSAVRDFMNTIQLHFRDSTTAWEHTSMLADGNVLVAALKRSLAYSALVKERKIPRTPITQLPFGEA